MQNTLVECVPAPVHIAFKAKEGQSKSYKPPKFSQGVVSNIICNANYCIK